jgi:co-chaperonin GroES (HSP10)
MKTETLLTSEIPKINLGLENKYKEENKVEAKEEPKEEDKTAELNKEPLNPDNIKSVVDELPTPSGWRLLVLPFTPKEKTSGGIIIAQESLDRLRIATNCGYVLKIGPQAYHDKERYPTGPWCKEGDWVIFARYAGSRLPIEGGEVRILNDDEVLGTIPNPESVLHYI